MGINVQVCWEKFANYWDVEMRLVPMEGDRFHLSAEEAVKRCDENTIGVVAILGSTFDGSYEPVQEIAQRSTRWRRRPASTSRSMSTAPPARLSPRSSIPSSSGTSDLPRVASINASGHKYGLVYPGVGWIVWRDAAALPEDLIFWVNYLGDNMPTFALNFSRPGAQIVAQYYNFLRLGFAGYRSVHGYARDVATRMSARIAELGPFELITKGDELPVFAFKLKDDVDNFTVFDVSNAVRERGWQLPAYTFPENRTDLAALRVVVKRGFTHDMADMLIDDLVRQLSRLEKQPAPIHDAATASGFSHWRRGPSSVCASTRAPGRWWAPGRLTSSIGALFAIGATCFFVAPFPGFLQAFGSASTGSCSSSARSSLRRLRPADGPGHTAPVTGRPGKVGWLVEQHRPGHGDASLQRGHIRRYADRLRRYLL